MEGKSAIEIREVPPDDIDSVNVMCTMPGSDPQEVLRESARVHQHVAPLGVRTLGAFQNGKPVGRLEIMPIDAAPLALAGDGLWVIRCLWVLEEAQGRGIAKTLMKHAIDIARGSKGIAVVTYENWMPVPFFEKCGFEVAGKRRTAALLLLKLNPDATVSFAPCAAGTTSNRTPIGNKGASCTPEVTAGEQPAEEKVVRVEAVFSGRCPWLMQSWRRWLKVAREVSDKVVTSERIILTRADAVRFGDENIHIDGVPYDGSPVQVELFRKVVRDGLAAKGLG